MDKRVEKLDDPKIFDAIKTNLVTTSGLKPYELQKYNSLFNQFRALSKFGLEQKDKGQLAWVANNWLEIIKYVKETYLPPKYAASFDRIKYFWVI